MKIVLVTSWLSQSGGGVATSLEGVSAALAGKAAQVDVVGLADERWMIDKERWAGARVHAYPVQTPGLAGYARNMLDGIRALKPDVVHSHGLWLYPSACVSAWARKTGLPYVVSPHGMLDPWAVKRSRFKKRVAGWLYEMRHLRGARCLHALCEQEAQSIRAFGLENPVCVVPNGVSVPSLAGPAPAPPWAGFGPPHGRVLLFLGRLHEKKNLHGLLEAMARIGGGQQAGGLGEWYLAVAGWDQEGYGAALKAGLEASGLNRRVIFLGAVSGAAKDAVFRHADAFILPSFSEGLPMAVLEAWSYGLPVAMTAACNLPEGFRAGAAFELSLQDLRGSLAEFLSLDREAMKAMGARGRALCVEKFAWGEVAARMLDVYGGLLAGISHGTAR